MARSTPDSTSNRIEIEHNHHVRLHRATDLMGPPHTRHQGPPTRDRWIHRVRPTAFRPYGITYLPSKALKAWADIPRDHPHALCRTHRLQRVDPQYPSELGKDGGQRFAPTPAGRGKRPWGDTDG